MEYKNTKFHIFTRPQQDYWAGGVYGSGRKDHGEGQVWQKEKPLLPQNDTDFLPGYFANHTDTKRGRQNRLTKKFILIIDLCQSS